MEKEKPIKKTRNCIKIGASALALSILINVTGCGTLSQLYNHSKDYYSHTPKEFSNGGIPVQGDDTKVNEATAERLIKTLNDMEKTAPLIISILKEHGTIFIVKEMLEENNVAEYLHGLNEIDISPQIFKFDISFSDKDKSLKMIPTLIISHETIHMLQDYANVLRIPELKQLKPSERGTVVNFLEMDASVKGYIFNHPDIYKEVNMRNKLLKNVAEEWYGYDDYSKSDNEICAYNTYEPNTTGITLEKLMSAIASVGDINTYSPETVELVTKIIQTKTIEKTLPFEGIGNLTNADKLWELNERRNNLINMYKDGKIASEEQNTRITEINTEVRKLIALAKAHNSQNMKKQGHEPNRR